MGNPVEVKIINLDVTGLLLGLGAVLLTLGIFDGTAAQASVMPTDPQRVEYINEIVAYTDGTVGVVVTLAFGALSLLLFCLGYNPTKVKNRS